VTLPPGAGNGWAAEVQVADRDSSSSPLAHFSYSQPLVTSHVPRSSCLGGQRITVFAANLGLADLTSQV